MKYYVFPNHDIWIDFKKRFVIILYMIFWISYLILLTSFHTTDEFLLEVGAQYIHGVVGNVVAEIAEQHSTKYKMVTPFE